MVCFCSFPACFFCFFLVVWILLSPRLFPASQGLPLLSQLRLAVRVSTPETFTCGPSFLKLFAQHALMYRIQRQPFSTTSHQTAQHRTAKRTRAFPRPQTNAPPALQPLSQPRRVSRHGRRVGRSRSSKHRSRGRDKCCGCDGGVGVGRRRRRRRVQDRGRGSCRGGAW
eukprot:3768118-Rhodomonas_salina.1